MRISIFTPIENVTYVMGEEGVTDILVTTTCIKVVKLGKCMRFVDLPYLLVTDEKPLM